METTEPSTQSRFITAATIAGCEIDVVPAVDASALDLVDGTVASRGALERYPWLGELAARPSVKPLVSFPRGIVVGEMGIAETGSVLVIEEELADRLVSMMSEDLVVLLNANTLADHLEAAGEWFDRVDAMPRYVVLITGPSRTADIERSLTIGVQGPRTTRIVLVGDGS